MLDLIDITPTGKLIAAIDGKYYLLQNWENGNWRAVMVDIGIFGGWSVCDDDDYIIREGKILWKEVGWNKTRTDYVQ